MPLRGYQRAKTGHRACGSAANANYWDKARGPRLAEVVFRNDLSYEDALELVCTTTGEVDIVTNVRPADADRVEESEYAKLVSLDAIRAVVGIINRDAADFPLHDKRARQALNLCVDREQIVDESMFGRATARRADAAISGEFYQSPFALPA